MIAALAALLIATAPVTTREECPTPREARRLTTVYANRVLGDRTVADARACAQQLGWKFRVTRRNDCHLPRTLDKRRDRVNATVVEGKVLYVYVG